MSVYLDHNATSPLAPEVFEMMTGAMREGFGNPSSPHQYGAAAKYVLEKARRSLAKGLGGVPAESLVFTSGGSEANNLALRGVVQESLRHGRGNHLIVSAAEHLAVLETAQDLAAQLPIRLTILDVDSNGRVDPDALKRALRVETILVSVIAANNETGALNDVRLLAEVTHQHSHAVFHTDAVQWFGRLPLSLKEWGADFVTLAAHKCGGPKGIGALYVRTPERVTRQISGGRQESGLRAGTENSGFVAGMAAALKLNVDRFEKLNPRLRQVREGLWKRILGDFPKAVRNTPLDEQTLPNTLNFSLPGADSARLIGDLDAAGFAVSAGSACTSEGAGSHVLLAMGRGNELARAALRVSFGPETRAEELEGFCRALAGLR